MTNIVTSLIVLFFLFVCIFWFLLLPFFFLRQHLTVAQAGPGAHSYPPASASQELGSQVCATTPSLFFLFYKIVFLSSFDFFYK